MDFASPREVLELRDQVGAFVDERVIPIESEILGGLDDEVRPSVAFPEIMRQLRAEAREQGLWNLFSPRLYAGLSHHEYGPICEEMRRSLAAPRIFNCEAPDTGNAEILLEFGTAEQQAMHLEPLLAGDVRSCFAMTEPEVAGSDPTRLRTRAVWNGDDWVINGHKWFVTGAVGAEYALVMAVTDPDAEPHARASVFIVPMNTPGLELVRAIPVLGLSGGPSHGELRFSSVRVPASSLLGDRGKGFAIVQSRLGPGRLHHCMRALGGAERALGLMVARARTRELRDGVLADRQMIQDFIATTRVEIEAARLLVLRAAWHMDREGKRAAARDVSLAKIAAPSAFEHAVDRAIQVYGAAGLSDHLPLAAMSAHARTLRLVDGADEVHKVVVARGELA